MKILSTVDDERSLVDLVGDSILHLGSEHHLGAVHIIEHHIIKFWFKSVLVDEIEVNLLICCDLDTDITFDVIDGASLSYGVVLDPFSLVGHIVKLKAIKVNVT